jgi:Amt family ammonium transporter
MNIKGLLRVDDTFDVFAVHGIGGVVGNLLTGVFAQKSVAGVDGTIIEGGWLDGNWMQVPIQALDTVAGMAWSFVVTWILLFIIDHIPGLHIRASPEEEREGLDRAELGVSMYEHIEEFKSTVALTSVGSVGGFVSNGHNEEGKKKGDKKRNGKRKEEIHENETEMERL